MQLLFATFLLISSYGHASIFDTDDRVDTKFSSIESQELARSVPALIPKRNVSRLPDGKYKLSGIPLESYGICSDEAFAEESIIANCSASFIGEDRILTAGHCLDPDNNTCETYNVVFDYVKGTDTFDPSRVYHCRKVLFREFDETLVGIDLAIIQLDRKVTDREPIELDLGQNLRLNDPLTLIGYPLGISQKVVETGKVTSLDIKNVSFHHDLDSFSVNSGSPIFSSQGKQVGVMVRGTGANLDRRNGRSCDEWHIDNGKGFSAGNDLSPLKDVL